MRRVKLKDLICESLDNPYNWRNTFSSKEEEVEDEDSGEVWEEYER